MNCLFSEARLFTERFSRMTTIHSGIFLSGRVLWADIREIKLDVTWSYVKRQTAKMTSEFVFFPSNPRFIKSHKNRKMHSPQIQILSLYCSKT